MIKTKLNQTQIKQKSSDQNAQTFSRSEVKINKKSSFQSKQILQQSDKKSFESLSQLIFQYKLSMEYSPAMGIYIVPDQNNFYNWHFYLFLRQGYYKDSKLKGLIKFDKFNSNKIVQTSFITPVFHPLVQFSTGKIDLSKLKIQKTPFGSEQIFSLLLNLKEMFINEKYLLINNSFNEESAKIYQKSEVLFIQKVFQTTVIPSQSFLFENQTQIEQNESISQILSEQQEIELIRQKLKELCPNTSSINLDQSLSKSQNDSQEPIDSKVSKFLQMVMN